MALGVRSTKCHETKDASLFRHAVRKDRPHLGPVRSSWCKECQRKRHAAWRDRNPNRSRELNTAYNIRLRAEVIEAYGGSCICCGEDEPAFLSIDHIGGGGNKHRREINKTGAPFWQWMKNEGWPSGFQILCHNCNMATRYGKECPHQLKEVRNGTFG